MRLTITCRNKVLNTLESGLLDQFYEKNDKYKEPTTGDLWGDDIEKPKLRIKNLGTTGFKYWYKDYSVQIFKPVYSKRLQLSDCSLSRFSVNFGDRGMVRIGFNLKASLDKDQYEILRDMQSADILYLTAGRRIQETGWPKFAATG